MLRKFRDRFLLANPVGKSFVDLYYTDSPPVANFLAKHDNLRYLVQCCLLPLDCISWLTFKVGFIPTITLIILFITLKVFVVTISFKKIRKQTIIV